MASGNRAALVSGLVIAWLMFAVVCFFNAMAATDAGRDLHIFKNSTGDIADKYETSLTPEGWAFTIWGVIYIYTAIWLIYSSTIFCRKTYTGDQIFDSIPFIPAGVYFSFSVANAGNIGWLFAWDRQELVASACVLFILPICLWVAIGFSCYGVMRNFREMQKSMLNADVWLDRVFIQNGLGLYAGWTTIASLLNLSITLTYKADLSDETSSILCLSILGALLLVFFLVDTIALDSYSRYLVTPYAVVPYALGAILDKNWDPEAPTWMVTIALFAASLAALVSKLIVLAYRSCTRPYHQTAYTPTTQGISHHRSDFLNLE